MSKINEFTKLYLTSRQILSTVGSPSIAVEGLYLCSEKLIKPSESARGEREPGFDQESSPNNKHHMETYILIFLFTVEFTLFLCFCPLPCLFLDDSRTTSQLDEFQECLSKFTRYNSVRPLATLSYASDLYNGSSIVSR